MKIVYVCESTYRSGGSERVLVNKANYLVRKAGYEVVVLTLFQGGRKCFYDIDLAVRQVDLNFKWDDGSNLVSRFFKRNKNFSRLKKGLEGVLEKEKADLVIATGLGVFVALLPSIKDGSRKILELHFTYSHLTWPSCEPLMVRINSGYRNRERMKCMGSYDKVVVLTENDRRDWIRCTKLKEVLVIPNGQMLGSEQMSDCENKNVIFVGRMSHEKGFDHLLRIWQLVVCRRKDWMLTIVGVGDGQKELQERVGKEGLSDSIRIIPCTTSMITEYLSASICIQTSLYEAFSMVLLEAMSVGLPVVAYDCKWGPSAIISSGENGFLIPVGMCQVFADCLVNLMDHKTLRKNIGFRAAETVNRKYGENVIMHQWIRLFEELKPI